MKELTLILALSVSCCIPAEADTIAYVVPVGTIGNQLLPAGQAQSLGMDFDVNSGIVITGLGVFDSGGDGLRSPLTAHIYDRDTRISLAQLTFTPANPGNLIGGSRFLPLAVPLQLLPGFHGVIAVDYVNSMNELNGNLRVSSGGWTTDSGGGLISFVGSGRHGLMGAGAGFPDIIETACPANCYAAGTFQFVPVPEPSTWLLLAVGGALAWLRGLRAGRQSP